MVILHIKVSPEVAKLSRCGCPRKVSSTGVGWSIQEREIDEKVTARSSIRVAACDKTV